MTKDELNAAVIARLAQIESALQPLTDEQAVELTTLFPVWGVGVTYPRGYRAQYGGKLYRCEQEHTSQEDWTPDITPSLWTEVAEPGTIPVWRQPTGAQDAYKKGDEVHYPTESDPVYVSDIDGNVWAPGVYGWSIKE